MTLRKRWLGVPEMRELGAAIDGGMNGVQGPEARLRSPCFLAPWSLCVSSFYVLDALRQFFLTSCP